MRIFKSVTPLLYSLLLPLFFCIHGWNESYDLIYLIDFIQAFLIIASISLLFFIIFYFLITVRENVELSTLLSMGVVLFFPFGLDETISLLKLNKSVTSIVFISTSIIFITVFFRHTKNSYTKLTKYIRWILIILVIIDTSILIVNQFKDDQIQPVPLIKKSEIKRNINDLPSVYIILLDEYAGYETLLKHANFKNDAFISELKTLGFHVVNNSSSNYNHTVLSIASFLNADYNNFSKSSSDKKFYKQSVLRIKNNRAVAAFSELGYQINNFSPFNLKNNRRFYTSVNIPSGSEIIISPTVIDNIYNSWLYFITRRLPNKSLFEKYVASKTSFNKAILDSIIEYSVRNKKPSFCFAHLNMPHAIYAKDSTGKINTPFLTKRNVSAADRTNAYLQYLSYTNKFILPYLQSLKRSVNNSDIIILMSDHGYREFNVDDINMPSFNNMLAVYSPKLSKDKWKDGFTNVNILRTVFSEISGVNLQLLKDSTFTEFIKE